MPWIQWRSVDNSLKWVGSSLSSHGFQGSNISPQAWRASTLPTELSHRSLISSSTFVVGMQEICWCLTVDVCLLPPFLRPQSFLLVSLASPIYRIMQSASKGMLQSLHFLANSCLQHELFIQVRQFVIAYSLRSMMLLLFHYCSLIPLNSLHYLMLPEFKAYLTYSKT